MMLSEGTHLGLQLTGIFTVLYKLHSILIPLYYPFQNAVHSFVELVEFIFTIHGVTVFLSNRVCQDPLENFFGMQRQRGRVKPNTSEFVKNTQALRVVNSGCATVRGNCRGTQKNDVRERQSIHNYLIVNILSCN